MICGGNAVQHSELMSFAVACFAEEMDAVCRALQVARLDAQYVSLPLTPSLSSPVSFYPSPFSYVPLPFALCNPPPLLPPPNPFR